MKSKLLLFFLGIIIFFSCVQEQKLENNNSSFQKLNYDWILGSWIRSNDETNKHTFEHWTKVSAKEYKGLGYTLENADTVFMENLRLLKINRNWIFEVTGVNETPTIFTFTEQTDTSFVSENRKNEFPKRIIYYAKGDSLTAIISDDKMEIPFIFKRLK